jgi:hypothetical protein
MCGVRVWRACVACVWRGSPRSCLLLAVDPGSLVVTVSGRPSAPFGYVYSTLVSLPEVLSVSPLSGPTSGGVWVELRGVNFRPSPVDNVDLLPVDASVPPVIVGEPLPCRWLNVPNATYSLTRIRYEVVQPPMVELFFLR